MTTGRWLALLVLVGVVVRLAAFPLGLKRADDLGLRFYDEYGGIAANIAEGDGFSYAWYGPERPTSIHAPIYPYIVAGAMVAFGEGRGAAVAILLLNTLLSALLLWILQRWARDVLGDGAAIGASLLLVFLPAQVYYAMAGLPSVFYALMLLLVLRLAWAVHLEPTLRHGLGWGVAIGVCALSYSFVLVLAPFLVLWLLGTGTGRRRPTLGAATVAATVAILLCVPWTIRNHEVHGHWILIRDQSGTNLWWGNSEYATGGAMDEAGNRLGNFPDEIAAQLRAIPNEVEGDRYLGQLAKEAIRSNPTRTARLWAQKVVRFWWFGNASGSPALQKFMPVIMLAKGGLLLLAAIGTALAWRRNRDLLLLVGTVALALTAIHMVFHSGRIRYFFPLEPLLALPAGVTLTYVWHRLRGRPAVDAPR